MSNSSELNAYIARLRKRLRLDAWLRGAAVLTGSALGVTLVLVLVLNHFAFPAHGVSVARLLIPVALATAAILGLALPLARLTRAHAVRQTEAAHPGLEQRLTTFEETAAKAGEPFLELLAADTLPRVQAAEPSLLVPDNRLFALGGAALGCVAVLLWLIADGPGFFGYGASLIWTGAKKDAAPLYAIAVKPGNITVRRNSDQLIVAHVSGMRPDKAQLFAHYQSAAGWERVAMQPAPDAGNGAAYQFVLAGLPENVEYYVAAGPLVSPHYKVRVVDLPSVRQIRVTYHYPAWTGMKPVAEEHSGDLRAIEGTDAQIEVEMDRPLHDGQLALDDGQVIHLAGGEGNIYRGAIHMEKDGAYHVAATDEGRPVRLSEDYFIATDKANPPQVAIDRPAGDYRASPIEEVTVGVKAADDFGLRDVHLHYSVNGGSDHDVSLLKTPGAKNSDGSTMLPLEDFKLVPGDVIGIYAAARDGHSEARTDIGFIQIDPFEREFSQSQQSGGGGSGGSDNQTEISKREKELIAATWKQENDKTATQKDAAAQGRFLSDAQQKLRDQVNALSVRMQSRDISQANEEFTDFDKDMQAAAAAMAPSADKLKATQWKDALPLEQKALQALLRAEATFRQIEVAFGQRGGGGGGGSGDTGRDLASLFDLELDTEKNQYETAQNAAPADQHEKDIEDALEKLDALAKREEDLANQPHDPQQSFQERWQQEMLRREAEQLQRQMEQLARNSQQGQQQSSDSGSSSSDSSHAQQSSSSQGGAQSQGGSQSSRRQAGGQPSGSAQDQSADRQSNDEQAVDQRMQEAMSRLQQATDIMKRSDAAQQNANSAREAAERLRDAANLLGRTQQQLASGRLDSLAREAGRLSQEERDQAQRIDKLANRQSDSGSAGGKSSESKSEGSDSSGDSATPDLESMMARLHQRDQLAQERQRLSDDLSKLQSNVRSAAREMAPGQPAVAQKLRDALTEMDESDLDNHVQRTADWLRSGIDPNSNGTESEIAQGLAKLSRQLQQAQSAMGQANPAQPGAEQGDQSAALDRLERLRNQLQAFSQPQNGNGAQPGETRDEQRDQPAGSLSRNGQQSGSNSQGGRQRGWTSDQPPLSRSGPSGGMTAQAGANPGNRSNGGLGGDTRVGGGSNGAVWGNFDTGNNTPRTRGQQQPAPADASGNPADSERFFDQRMRDVNQLRQMVRDDPQAEKDVADLARQMQRLDPSRFPGNPAMVEQMHWEIVNSVDKIELELQRDGTSSQARTGPPDTVPAGYQEPVADYYRRLSKNP